MKNKLIQRIVVVGILLIVSIGEGAKQPGPIILAMDSVFQKNIEARVEKRFDSLSKVYQFHSIEESNYRAVIDNLGSAYAPLSVATAILGLFMGMLGVLSAFGIYLLGIRKDREVNKVIEAKHSEISRIIEDLKENQKKEIEESLRYIKAEDEKRNKVINEYQGYLKQRMEELKSELSKSQLNDKSKLQTQIDEIQEKIFKAPLTYSFGSSAGATGLMSGTVTSAGSAFPPAYEILCQHCGNRTKVNGLLGVYAGHSKCSNCGSILKP